MTSWGRGETREKNGAPGFWVLLSSDSVAHEIQVTRETPGGHAYLSVSPGHKLKTGVQKLGRQRAPKLQQDLHLHYTQKSAELGMLESWCALPLLGCQRNYFPSGISVLIC